MEEPGGAVFEIAITPDTVIIGEPSVGDIVLVEALEEPGGLVALLIEVQNSQLAGPVREISNRVQQRAGH